MTEDSNIIVTASEVFDGMYAWFQANHWFAAIPVDVADTTQESAARQALLLLAQGDVPTFHRLPLGIQSLACTFIYSYMVQLRGPLDGYAYSLKAPAAPAADPAARAWLAIAHVIDQQSPPPPVRH
jgi:hypothetical protein